MSRTPTTSTALGLLLASWLLVPAARADVNLWGRYPDNYAYVESSYTANPTIDREAADDFDIVGSIERVVVLGRQCFGCGAPDVQGVWVRFWAWDQGQVGALQQEYFLTGNDPSFTFDPLAPTTLDIALPTPFVANGKHFVSAQLVTAGGSTWYWQTAGDGQHEIASVQQRDGATTNSFGPFTTPFGVVERDLAFELWGNGTPAPSTIPKLVWSQSFAFTAPAVPAASWPAGPTFSEPADDFDFEGTVKRVRLSSGVCYQCTNPTMIGARVRFYEWTSNGPGTLQFEQDVPVGPSAVYDGATTTIVLDPPFVATGKHFMSAMLLTTASNGFQWRTTKTTPAYGSALWVKSSTTGGNFGAWIQGGNPFGGDLAFQLEGFPTLAPPILPTGDPCGDWTPLYVPEPPMTNFSIMRDLAVVASDDVWAVGGTTQESAPLQFTGGPQIWHFDGATWSLEPTPDPEIYENSGGNSLDAIAAVAADDIWAAGTKRAVNPGGFVGQQIWVLHYDGQSWSEVDAPVLPTGVTGSFVRDIEVVSAGDIWFVGDWLDPVSCNPALAMHWDGSNFTVHSTPCSGLAGANGGFGLESVSAVSADDVWAVGGGGDGDFTYADNYIIHWDGSNWTYFAHDAPGFQHRLFAVEAIAHDDVWATGQFQDDFGYHAYAVHWNGSDFEVTVIPGGSLHLYAQAADDIYAVGGGIFHYDGTAWSWADDLGVLSGEDAGVSLTAIEGAGPCELVAVGRHIPLGSIRAHAARIALPHLWVSLEANGCNSDALPNSLVLTSGAKLGAKLRVQMDDRLDRGGLTPGTARAAWFIGFAPATNGPCGTPIAGLGVDGSVAELMFDLAAPYRVLIGAEPWAGPGSPIEFAVTVPDVASLAGLWIYTQGVWVDPALPQALLLTNGVEVRLGE